MILQEQNYIGFLTKELKRRMDINSSYSQRAFARYLGLSPGELSEILRGLRPLSYRSAIKISTKLGLSGAERDHLFSMVTEQKFPYAQKKDEKLNKKNLTNEVFELLSQWHYFAILNYMECEDFAWDEKLISKRLGIQLMQVREAISRMIKLGLIVEENGSIKRSEEEFVLSPDGVPSQAIQRYHHQMLAKAQEALITQNVSERVISGIGISIDPEQVADFKKDIDSFHEKMIKKYSKKNKKEVYQLETALFRVTEKV